MSLAARVLFRTVRSVSQVWGATAVEHVDNAAASATGWVASTMARSLRGVGYGARGLTEHGAFDAGNDDSLSVEEQAALDHFIDSVEAHAIASVFSVIAIALSCHLMYKHLQHYARPLLQRQIIRIVMIVPVYAFCSALSLGFDHYAPYINALRDVYEALCIHCFLALMLDFPGGEDAVIEGIREKPKMKHPKPFCWCPRIRLGVDFIVNMKRTTLQFVFLKPLMALISIAAMAADVFDTPELQTFLLIVYNLSYTTALYGLLLYYVATKQLMKGFSPVGKFGAVKIIVFATYYQSLAVVAIPGMDALGSSEKWNDFIICFEMAFFAVMHEYAFGYQEFLPGGVGVRDLKAMGYEEPTNIKIETDWRAALSRIPDVANISDVIADMRRNFSWSAGTYILQGVDGGIMNEGTVEMEEQRKAGTQASRIKAMLQGKRNQLKEEKGDEEEGKEGESGAAKAAAAAAAGTGMNGVANGSGADDGGDDGPTSPGSLAAAGGDFASELAAMQISESADVKAKEAREKAEKDRIEREQRMKEGEASKAAAIIAGVKDGGIVSGREAAASTAALMAASAAAAQQLLAKMKKEQDAASGGPAAARARRAAANQAAGSAAVEASVPSGQHQGSSGTGNGPDLRFAGDEDDNDGSGQAKALDELKKANPAFAGSIVATGLGGSKAGKVTGAAVAALGGAAVAVATTVTARVTESAARHGLGPRPKEAASDRITAANVLAPVVDGAPDAAEVERLVKDASIKAAKEKAERAAAAAAAAAAGGTSASGAGAAPAAQQPAAARLKIDASRVKVAAPASAGAAGASAKAASATPAAAAGWDGGFDEQPQAKPAATPASASSASATSGEWNPDAEFGAEAAAAPATAAVAAWDPDAAFADHAASAAPASAAAASSSSKSATPKSPPPAAGSAAKPAASAYASAASSAAGGGDAWDASDVSFDIPLAAVAATAASAVNAPGAGVGAPSSASPSGRARAPSGATAADDGVEAEAGGAAAAEEAQEAAAEQQERPIEDDGQESVHADDNNNGADDGAEQDEAGGEVVNAAPVPAAEQPAAAAEGFATLEEDSGDSDEQPEATAGSASPSTGHGRVPPQPPSGAASPVHAAADSDANGDAAPVEDASAEVEFPTAAAAPAAAAASGTASSHDEWGLSFDSDATAAFGNAAADAPAAGAVHVVDPFGDEVSFDLK